MRAAQDQACKGQVGCTVWTPDFTCFAVHPPSKSSTKPNLCNLDMAFLTAWCEENELQRSEGDSELGGLALGQVHIMFKSGSVLLQDVPTGSPASYPTARKGSRPGLLFRAIKMLKPLTHIPRLAATP